jgi:two-component system alkaline phosphatase synthesis response regulator PhoP
MEPKKTVILLAEDDPVVRNLVSLMLSKEGYSVLTANDGREAFEICRRFKDPIHLLLTDKTMPQMKRFGACGKHSKEKIRNQDYDNVR